MTEFTLKHSYELRAACTPEQAELLIPYDHHTVTVYGKRRVIVTNHWQRDDDLKRELIAITEYGSAYSVYTPAPPHIQAIIDRLTFQNKHLDKHTIFISNENMAVVYCKEHFHIYDLGNRVKVYDGEGWIIGLSKDEGEILIRRKSRWFRRYEIRQLSNGEKVSTNHLENFSIDQRLDIRKHSTEQIKFVDVFGKSRDLVIGLPPQEGRMYSRFLSETPIHRPLGQPIALICEHHEAGTAAVSTMNRFDLRDGSGGEAVGYSSDIAYYFPTINMVVQQHSDEFELNDLETKQRIGVLQFERKLKDPRYKREEIPESVLPHDEITGFAINLHSEHDIVIASNRTLHRIHVPYETGTNVEWILNILLWTTVWKQKISESISAIAIHPNGEWLVTWAKSGTLRAMNLDSQEIISEIR